MYVKPHSTAPVIHSCCLKVTNISHQNRTEIINVPCLILILLYEEVSQKHKVSMTSKSLQAYHQLMWRTWATFGQHCGCREGLLKFTAFSEHASCFTFKCWLPHLILKSFPISSECLLDVMKTALSGLGKGIGIVLVLMSLCTLIWFAKC